MAELGSSERNDRLLKAEAAALEAGGSLVRLVGLYHSGRCDADPEGVPSVLIDALHYRNIDVKKRMAIRNT